MKVKYKETSRGGLAVNVIDVLRKPALTCSFESGQATEWVTVPV